MGLTTAYSEKTTVSNRGSDYHPQGLKGEGKLECQKIAMLTIWQDS